MKKIVGLPRVRGDLPCVGKKEKSLDRSPPRARGSTLDIGPSKKTLPVSPACAGIYPNNSKRARSVRSLPRVRGDLPAAQKHFLGRL